MVTVLSALDTTGSALAIFSSVAAVWAYLRGRQAGLEREFARQTDAVNLLHEASAKVYAYAYARERETGDSK